LATKTVVFTYLLVLVNLLVFIYGLSEPEAYNWLVTTYGLVPAQIVKGQNLSSLVVSMFLHADLLHVGMNMLFLFLSGDAIEREIGNFRFLGLYFACGIIAGLFHAYMNNTSTIPAIGASGAIFGVLAALAIIFPFRWFLQLFGIIPIPIPAILFVFITMISETAYVTSGVVENVAHTAHVGGFLAGVFITLLIIPKKKDKEKGRARKLVKDNNRNNAR
jgi:membrane associated rhomboid family serine protease